MIHTYWPTWFNIVELELSSSSLPLTKSVTRHKNNTNVLGSRRFKSLTNLEECFCVRDPKHSSSECKEIPSFFPKSIKSINPTQLKSPTVEARVYSFSLLSHFLSLGPPAPCFVFLFCFYSSISPKAVKKIIQNPFSLSLSNDTLSFTALFSTALLTNSFFLTFFTHNLTDPPPRIPLSHPIWTRNPVFGDRNFVTFSLILQERGLNRNLGFAGTRIGR